MCVCICVTIHMCGRAVHLIRLNYQYLTFARVQSPYQLVGPTFDSKALPTNHATSASKNKHTKANKHISTNRTTTSSATHKAFQTVCILTHSRFCTKFGSTEFCSIRHLYTCKIQQTDKHPGTAAEKLSTRNQFIILYPAGYSMSYANDILS